MKKLALMPLILFAGLIAFAIWFFINLQPVTNDQSFLDFSVNSGEGASQIGRNLYAQGLIKNPVVFKVYIQFSGLSSSIQAGNYRLSPSFNLFQVVNVLAKSPVQIKVTIPEGFTNEEIAQRFAKSLNQNKTFIDNFAAISKDNEGYLFPDTYLIPESATPSSIIEKMRANFDTRTKGMKLTRNQVILASIIEKETKSEEERPIVAGILMNRLNAGMLLQVDVAPETYQKNGLPLAPISNPGLVSLKAAANPQRSDYWYYIHDHEGNIHYAKTLDEQNANINKYLR